ncbi:MAG: cytochrome c family protein [Deltaproteobacteria bacterium]|nr:cytochrome c family protein [Deltaproteobacteria bacterium]
MRALGLALVLCAALGGRARADRAAYVGSAACGACHAAELAAWQASAHARAGQAVVRAPRRCLACHGTGDAPAGAAYWAEVGCEACHGPGAAYAADDLMRDRGLVRRLGLRDLAAPAGRAAVCAGCHRDGAGTRLMPLTPAELARPVHPVTARVQP